MRIHQDLHPKAVVNSMMKVDYRITRLMKPHAKFIELQSTGGLGEEATFFCLAASLLTKSLYLGFIPLAAAAWMAEDLVCRFIGEFILTDQRIWVRGSPHALSQSVIPLEDITSLTWPRDAIFMKQKSTQKIQVHMSSDDLLFIEAYEQFIGKSITT